MWTNRVLAANSLLAVGVIAPPTLAQDVDWSKAELVKVVTVENTFQPRGFTFRKGTVYRLHIENHGKELHEFASPAFFKSVKIKDPSVLNADRTEIDVRPGEGKDLVFLPMDPGSFKLTCPDHDWDGMEGEIAVVP